MKTKLIKTKQGIVVKFDDSDLSNEAVMARLRRAAKKCGISLSQFHRRTATGSTRLDGPWLTFPIRSSRRTYGIGGMHAHDNSPAAVRYRKLKESNRKMMGAAGRLIAKRGLANAPKREWKGLVPPMLARLAHCGSNVFPA